MSREGSPPGWLAILAVVAVATGACRERHFDVPTASMEPTIRQGDRIRMVRLGDAAIHRGDLIVFSVSGKPNDLHVKRVVGLAGDRVEIRSKQVILNGKQLSEPFAVHSDPTVYEKDAPIALAASRDQMAARTVGEGFVLVLGDNRDNSLDSRFYGDVPVAHIAGRVPLER